MPAKSYTGSYFTKQSRYVRMLDALGAGGQFTIWQIARDFFLTHTTARRYVLHLRAKGLLRIVGWLREHEDKRGPWQAIYALGIAPDVPKPAPTPLHLRVAKCQARVKADPDAHARGLAVRRAAKVRKLSPGVVDPVLSALMGGTP